DPHTGHDERGGLGDRGTRCLGDEWHGARGARIRLENIEDSGADRELYIEQAAHTDAGGNGLGGGADPEQLLPAERDRWKGAARVAGVDPGLLDVLHDPAGAALLAVVECVDIGLGAVAEKAISEQRVDRSDDALPADTSGGVLERRVVVDVLHAAAAE